MPLPDITNPDYIKFFVESCEKTAKLRQRWNLVHQDRLHQAATLTREDKNLTNIDVIKANMLGGMAATVRDHVASRYNRRQTPLRDAKTMHGVSSMLKGHSIQDVGLGDPEKDPRLARPDTDFSPDPIMRPVNPEQTKILFKPKPFFGREVYLKKRNLVNPEDKYYFALTSGWDYGWRLKDTPFSRHRPEFGNVYRLKRDQMSRVGPQPDPDHYTSTEKGTVSKCN